MLRCAYLYLSSVAGAAPRDETRRDDAGRRREARRQDGMGWDRTAQHVAGADSRADDKRDSASARHEKACGAYAGDCEK
jgi:hypothetical protein